MCTSRRTEDGNNDKHKKWRELCKVKFIHKLFKEEKLEK